jgi:hypothetical protein
MIVYYNQISDKRYEEMSIEQGERCAICGDNKELVVDHDYKTNVVRKLLCRSCNMAIGLLKENLRVIRKAANYIIDEDIRIQSGLLMCEYKNASVNPKDWRSLEPTLTREQLVEIASLTPDKMRSWASRIGVTEKTISNWRQSARERLAR